MANEIYNAFVEARLEKQARQLSTTIDGKVVPALGHYIVILDSMIDNMESFINSSNLTACNSLIDAKRELACYIHSIRNNKEYELLKKHLPPELFSKLDTVHNPLT